MKLLKMAFLLIVGTQLSACATATSPVSGSWYMDVKGPVGATTAFGGTAEGEACATSILGLIATGDASVEAAKKNGGIAQVVSMDHKSSNLLGLYAKYCLVIHGKKGTAARDTASQARK